MAIGGPAVHRRGHWYRPKSIGRSLAIRPRLYFSALAGLAALVLLPKSWPASLSGAVAWDLSAAIYLALAFRVMVTWDAERIRARAARQDDSAIVILVIILLAITVSFVAIAGLLGVGQPITATPRVSKTTAKSPLKATPNARNKVAKDTPSSWWSWLR